MALTSHGHHIPDSGNEEEDRKASRDRCGGMNHCRTCRMEVAAYREENPPLPADLGKVDLVDWDIDANRPMAESIAEYEKGLEHELATLLNRHSKENESGTPDFILAGFLIGVLDTYNKTLGERAAWRGESVELPALQRLRRNKEQSDIYRELMDYRPPPVKNLEPGSLEAGDTLGPIDDIDGSEVPLVIYTNAQRNEVGTAKVHVTPGEVHVTGTITGVIPIFGAENISAAYSLELPEEKEEPPAGPFGRYQQKGLTDND